MTPEEPSAGHLWSIMGYFLRLGMVGGGGPVALCGVMKRDLVEQRAWLDKEAMREAVAASQILPGPLAMQVCIFISYARGGLPGAWLGGISFVLPNVVIVTALAALYVHYQELSWLNAVLYGATPAIVALILHASWRLSRLGMEDWFQWAIALAAFAATVAAKAELEFVFLGAGLAGWLYYGSPLGGSRLIGMLGTAASPLKILGPAVQVLPAGTYESLITFFFKAGALTFGSGLVLLPALELGVVGESKWLTHREFLVAATVGMISQGPVIIMATFVGYLVAGVSGALASTVAVFLPSFLLVLVAAPILRRHRANPGLQGCIRGAFGAAIGTISGAAFLLGRIGIGDAMTVCIGLAVLLVLFRFQISNLLLITLAGGIGVIAYPILQPAWLLAS
jgi:chromate transporter